MLPIVSKFPFCAFVAEEFYFAVGEFRYDRVLKRAFTIPEEFGLGDESNWNAFNTF